jgi:hypothetical protein
MSTRRAALLIVLAVAAALRFTGLGWGLRHPPHVDEQPFVHWTFVMLRHADLDHRFYEYPGLFFYLLAPALALIPKGGAAAYLAARAVVASFGVASVGLVYLLGRALRCPRAGLLAAAVLAVSPNEVRVAHMIRPDVVLEAFALLALLAFSRVGEEPRWDAASGAAAAAATAVKFTGVLLGPSYLVQRLLRPGFRWTWLLWAGLAALAAFALLSPYSLLHFRDALQGAQLQATWHYVQRGPAPTTYAQRASEYVRVVVRGLGAIGAALAVVGAVVWRRDWRRWAFVAVLPVCAVLVLASADVNRLRFLTFVTGAVALFAGVALDAITRRSVAAGAIAALVCLGLPAAESARFAFSLAQPTTKDLALDWVNAHVPAGSRILTTWVADMGLDSRRYEVVRIDHLDDDAWRQAVEADVVVCGPSLDGGDVLQRLTTVHEVLPLNRESGPRLQVRIAPRGARPRYEPVPLADVNVSASSAAPLLERLRDEDLTTAWTAEAAPAWIEVDLPQPRTIGRIEVNVPPGTQGEAPRVVISEDGASWREVPTLPGRPPLDEQQGAPSHLLLMEPTRARRIRLEQGRSPSPWSITELRIDVIP